MAMPSVSVLAAHHPLRCETTTKATMAPTSKTRYTSAPVLNGMPKSFTKNNSKPPASCTAPLIKASCTNPRSTMETAPVMTNPFHENV